MVASAKQDEAGLRSAHYFDAHHRFIASLLLAILFFFGFSSHHALITRLITSWDVFAFSAISFSWAVLITKDPYEVRLYAPLEDSGRKFLFTIVVLAATVSLIAVFIMLGEAKSLNPTRLVEHIILGVGAILLSWTLVHSLFGLRYAHHYYDEAKEVDRHEIDGGLLFPEDKNPDYLDFAYFSFVIGMTCQVSDVQITSKKLRRLALLHGLISFIFNTAILAMLVNMIAGLT